MENTLDELQKKAGRVQHVYSKLVGPILSILVSATLLGMMAYLVFGGAFDIGVLADEHNVVRIPVVLLIVALPLGWLVELVGFTAGVSIISAVLGFWLLASIVSLIKTIKKLRSAK
ncbi:MAG: hypothetical protein LBL23_04595 [Coriobacteriales bacterium]|nr:hypothetical protein [Coriobacteriales bacterium]